MARVLPEKQSGTPPSPLVHNVQTWLAGLGSRFSPKQLLTGPALPPHQHFHSTTGCLTPGFLVSGLALCSIVTWGPLCIMSWIFLMALLRIKFSLAPPPDHLILMH